MPEKIAVELGHVQKTLLLPLWGRAVETQKSEPLLVDPTALSIIQKIQFDFRELSDNLSEISQLGWVIRSLSIDRTVKRFLEKYPQGAIVNIGCGFDTTFERIDNGRLTWYDLDLPDVINMRKLFISENERRKFLPFSLLDYRWTDQLKPNDHFLFIAAGVLYYLEEEKVRGFFQKLAHAFPKGEMVFDASSPVGIKMANKMVVKKSGLDENSFLKWGLKSARSIGGWDRRIRVLEEYPMFKETRNRFKNKMTALISDVFKMQYMVHLQFE